VFADGVVEAIPDARLSVLSKPSLSRTIAGNFKFHARMRLVRVTRIALSALRSISYWLSQK